MPDILQLTRDQLALILGDDQRAIRAFENLFRRVVIIEEGGTIIQTVIEARVLKANSIAQDALRIAKAGNTLLWLSI